MLKLTKPLAFFDIESTGINIATDRIVEISIFKLMPSGEQIWKTMRINPTIPINPQATEVHGITNEDVQNEPTFAEVAADIFNFLKDCDLAGYNSNYFDVPLLNEEFLRLDMDLKLDKRKFVDVFRIFQKKEKRDLSSAYKFYCDKNLENAHSAEADVQATYEVLLGQLDRYEDLENDISSLDKFSNDKLFVDFGRRLINDKGVVKFNFGKHRGRAVEDVLRREPQYYDWIMKSDFLLDTKQKLRAIRLGMKFKMK